MPFITIITPTYNRKDLLEKAISSVIHQDQTIPFEWEMIIIDDGSNDNTFGYIEKYLNEFKNIHYIYQENGGVGMARNIGIKNTNPKSDYTIFLDSDDELNLSLIGKAIQEWESLKLNGKYEYVFGLYYFCKDENGILINNQKNKFNNEKKLLKYEDYLCGNMDMELLIVIKSSIFKNYSEFRFSEEFISEGILWSKIWKMAGEKGYAAVLINEVGRLYRRFHTSEKKITYTLTVDRFIKNARGNELVLDVLGKDILEYGFTQRYADFLFRIGVNWILSGEKRKGRKYLSESLKYNKTLRILGVYLFSYVNEEILLGIYKLYIKQ